MKTKNIQSFILCFCLFLVALIFPACSCSNNGDNDDYTYHDDILLQYFDSTMPDGTLEFTHSILNFGDFGRIMPLGNINPPGHTFPTDHIYFVSSYRVPVYAPSQGKILFIEDAGMYGDGAIIVAVTNTLTYYLGHIFVDEEFKVGDTVLAGTQIGLSGNTSCVDFGLLNKDIDNGFISDKMPLTTKYGDKPLLRYTEPLRSQLYALVKPPTPNTVEYPDFTYDGDVTDGEFAVDVAGTLSGNWIQEGKINSGGWYEWEDTLSFGYDMYYPDKIVIGSGKYYNAFILKNEDNPIRPENANTTLGKISYYLYSASNTVAGIPTGPRTGIMIVQMLSDNRIKLEIFEDTVSTSRDFTNEALYYSR